MKMLQLITCSASVLWMNNAQLRYPAAPPAILLHASEAADIAAIVARLPTAPALIKHPIHALPNAHPGLCRETKAPYEFAEMKEEGEGGRNRKGCFMAGAKKNKRYNAAFVCKYNDVCSLLSALASLNS